MTLDSNWFEAYSRNLNSNKSLDYIERSTFLNTVKPFDASDYTQGRLLAFISSLLRPKTILEIGTFSGYATVCMCEGLASDGKVKTIECNEDLKDLIDHHISYAGFTDQVEVIIGSALEMIDMITEEIDMVFIDANKREYNDYYEKVLPKVRSGGVIIADNVLWKGEVWQEDKSKIASSLDNFNDRVAKDNRVKSFILPHRDGLLMITKN